MNEEEKRKLLQDVFAPKRDEKVLILIDEPHDDILDSPIWKERREMAQDWFNTFQKMGEKEGFSVEMTSFPATGANNKQIPEDMKNLVRNVNLVIAMTEYSATSSLVPICGENNTLVRCASMPGVEKRMEKTSFQSDYIKVKKYALAIERILSDVIAADIDFSTDDHLHIDLRNRTPLADIGDCTKPGQMINFPSGETCIVPYEAGVDEKNIYGKSRTKGVLPVDYNGEILRYKIHENKITKVMEDTDKAGELESFFNKKSCRRNIAELGIGCNPKAVVTGNILEDEKVPGLHIAYGMSSHIGGIVSCDMHQDICYPKGAPIEATSLILLHKNGKKTELINENGLRFELLN